MSPVPDPSQNHSGNSNTFDINSEGHVINTGLIFNDSSSEEEQQGPISEIGGYQPLSQGPDSLEEEIDYNSLSGLLNAFSTHGPNEMDSIDNTDEDLSQNSNVSSNNLNALPLTTQTNENNSEPSPTLQTLILESERQASEEYMNMQTSVWNLKSSNEIEIDKDKENEIKSVMAKITLPSTAIPSWARELSDEEWRKQISSRIFGEELSGLQNKESK